MKGVDGLQYREAMEELAHCLPRNVGRVLIQQPEGSVREIRIRAGQKTAVHTSEGVRKCMGEPAPHQVQQIAEALCEHALYARAEEQRSGFVTLRGGHRMGLCGRVLLQGQSVRALREISSLCIRVAGQWRGAADRLMPHLTDANGRVNSLLIIGLPGTGKTTMLRDACRRLSEMGCRVGVVDERSEIAAMSGGEAQMDVGPNTDVLDGCCKEAGLRWMLRAMCPDVLVTDELGGACDAQAVMEAVNAGVSVISTLHGRDIQKAAGRGTLAHLVQNRAFDRYVLLTEDAVGCVGTVYDEQLRQMESTF
ncbi:MAG: stage III sporulation protein AA [Clostridiales bacterium]|nr:stage III sporulation protein AA [Clostridiales bacterium]